MAAPQEVGAIFRRATERGPEEVARLLDAQPHLIKARGVQGTTFLMEAAGYGRVEIVTLLLARGADVALMNGRGGTALYIAGVSGHREVASVLLSSGADLWRTGFHGRTPLIAASKGCQEAMVILFVGHMGGRGLDEVDMDGCTALWYACGAGLVEASKALLLAGADHTIDSIWGQTPQDIARQRFRRDCVDLIQWWDGQLHRAYVLHKARAVHEHAFMRQKGLAAPIPAYLSPRVQGGRVMPSVEAGARQRGGRIRTRDTDTREEEIAAMVGYVVRDLAPELYVELIAGFHFTAGVFN